MSLNKLIYIVPTVAMFALSAWEDHPDRQDFKDSDRNFRDAQEESGSRGKEDAPVRGKESDGGRDTSDYSASSRDNFTPDRDR